MLKWVYICCHCVLKSWLFLWKGWSNIHSIRLIIHFLILTVSLEWKRLMWWTKEGEVLWWSLATASCWWRQPDRRGQWLDCTAHIDLRRTSPWLATDWWACLRNRTNVRVTLRQCDRTFLFCAPSLQRNTYFLKRHVVYDSVSQPFSYPIPLAPKLFDTFWLKSTISVD
jgi:hypothetical protein